MKWPFANLESLGCEVTKGTTPRTLGREYVATGIPFVRAENLDNRELEVEKIDTFIDADTDVLLSRSRIEPHDVLVSIAGTIGRVAVVPTDAPKMNCNQAVGIIRVHGGISPHFLKFWLLSPDACNQMASMGVSLTIANLSLGALKRLKIPLPAPCEQLRIVELLEQADGLRRQRTDANALSNRIIPALFCHLFGEPTTNPKKWPTLALNKLADFVSGATPSKDTPAFWDGTIPWVSPKDMKRSELHDAIDHVSDKALADTNLKLIPANTALIVVRGMILVHTVPVCLARVPVTINQDMKALSAKGDATAEFLQWALLTQHNTLLRLVTTAAHGTKKLDTEALGALEIPIPPPSRKDLIQKWTSIVRQQQMAAGQRSECSEAIQRLWQVMLHRAFTGELTAKWREAHLKEVLVEMEHQVKMLRTAGENN